MTQDPNTFDKEIQDANANLDPNNKGTVTETTVENPVDQIVDPTDYQKKFSESSREALRLLEEKKAAEAKIKALEEQLKLKDTPPAETTVTPTENLYPGFEYLDEEGRKNLIAYTNSVTARAKEELLKDPAIAFARKTYNENRWEQAFSQVAEKHPELKASKDDFKSKYFSPANVPNNIDSILGDIAKIYLFDKVKDLGAEEERAKANRIELERNTGGDRTPSTSRTLADWNRMAQENPAKFATLAKEFNADVASGKLKE